jgi:hypothetical protein
VLPELIHFSTKAILCLIHGAYYTSFTTNCFLTSCILEIRTSNSGVCVETGLQGYGAVSLGQTSQRYIPEDLHPLPSFATP